MQLPVPGNGPGSGSGVGPNPGGGLPYAQPYRSIAPSLFSSSSSLTLSIDPNTRPPIQGQGQGPGYPPSSSTVIAAAPTSYGYNPPSNVPGTVSYSAPPSSFSAYALPSLTPSTAASTGNHPVPVPQNIPQNIPALGDVTLVWADEEYSMVRFI